MSKKKSIKNWFQKHNKDVYVKQSQSESYRSRAVYKLEDINNKYNLISNSINILDLGSSPGAWTEFICRNFNDKNLVSVDTREMEPVKGSFFIKGDITKTDTCEKIRKKFKNLDLVLSDIAPNITGIQDVDQANFTAILQSILGICSELLVKDGGLVMKYFIGSSYDDAAESLRTVFSTVDTFKPKSSRSKSNEIFFVCIGHKD